MKKNNLFAYTVLLFISMTIISCKKTTNNILTGNWLLTAQHDTKITITAGAGINGTDLRDTTFSDTSFTGKSEVLELNGNNSYSVSVYSTNPITVVYGKYSFTGEAEGEGTLALVPDSMPAYTENYVLIPSINNANPMLIFPSTTSGPGFTESDTTIYTFD